MDRMVYINKNDEERVPEYEGFSTIKNNFKYIFLLTVPAVLIFWYFLGFLLRGLGDDFTTPFGGIGGPGSMGLDQGSFMESNDDKTLSMGCE